MVTVYPALLGLLATLAPVRATTWMPLAMLGSSPVLQQPGTMADQPESQLPGVCLALPGLIDQQRYERNTESFSMYYFIVVQSECNTN